MTSINIYKKSYRTLDGSIKNKAIRKIEELFHDVSYSVIEDAMWDANLNILYSHGGRHISFEPKSFKSLCSLMVTYTAMELKKEKDEKRI